MVYKFFLAFMLSVSCFAATNLHLDTVTNPDVGTAGLSVLYITESNLVNIPLKNVVITITNTCGGSLVASPSAASIVQIKRNSERVGFLIPPTLSNGMHYVKISGTNATGVSFVSSNCSGFTSQPPPPIVARCIPIIDVVGIPLNPTAMFASGGIASPYTFTATGLPAGLFMNASGVLSGTPTTGAGVTTYTVVIVDTVGVSGTFTCSADIVAMVTTLPSGALGCNGSGALGILNVQTPGTVTAYVPNGHWNDTYFTSTVPFSTGIARVTLEPTPGTPPAAITTPHVVNTCSVNSSTKTAVCVANETDVYVIPDGLLSPLFTLTSGSTMPISSILGSSGFDSGFSGGDCQNCGVVVNHTTNQAAIEMGMLGAKGGIQFLDLSDPTHPVFVGAPIKLTNDVSEQYVWDDTRNYIFSANEEGKLDIFSVMSMNSIIDYARTIPGNLSELNATPTNGADTVSMDCTTGIAVVMGEASSSVYLANMSSGGLILTMMPNAWTAPDMFKDLSSDFTYLHSEMIYSSSIAPGSHYGLVAGEFGLTSFGAFQLPSTAGLGAPDFVDWVKMSAFPKEPNGCDFKTGQEPHAVNSYVSPINGRAYGVIANGFNGPPNYLAVVDLQALLSATRVSATHTVAPSVDLQATGILRYVETGNSTLTCNN